MASCLVPDFPAVMVALEHLKELDKQLREDGVPFAPEASFHLTEITTAITELEADRHAAHEHLEVENIENSKLRHQINNIRERMSQDILADVAAARECNAEEIEQLRKDLKAASQLQEATVKSQDSLLRQNEMLYPEREQVKVEHEEIIATLNDSISLKYGLQMQLDQKQEQIEELKSCTAAVEQDKITLQQNLVLEREAFTTKQENLSTEADQTEEKIKQQKQTAETFRRELDRVNDKKRETLENLGELTIHMARLESNLRRLTDSRCQYKNQLEGETQRYQELRQQREMLRKEQCELGEVFSATLQRLEEEIVTVGGKIEEGRASRLLCQDHLAQIYEIFKRQQDEENEVRAEHLHVLQQVSRSKLQLMERSASMVKHSMEIKEMEKQIADLLETYTVNKRMFERNQEEMCGTMDTEQKNISQFEEENRRLKRLLEEEKRKQEKHVAKMSSDIGSTRRRYQELQQEEAALQLQQPQSVNVDLLMGHVTQCEVEYRQKETKHCEEIEQCTAEVESIARSNEEKQKEVEREEELLKEVEERWNEEQSRYQRLETLKSELRQKRNDLELWIEGLKEQTSSLLQPREEMKAKLEEMRESYMDMLDKQVSELRAAEMSIYDNRVKLEQVSMENSRLHLSIKQMTEGVSRAREDIDRYWQETHRFKQDTEALFEGLQEAWGEDLLVTQDCQSSDGMLLVSMSAMMSHLKTRKQQLQSVSTLLHQQMLDFSKRLGDKTTVEQQS